MQSWFKNIHIPKIRCSLNCSFITAAIFVVCAYSSKHCSQHLKVRQQYIGAKQKTSPGVHQAFKNVLWEFVGRTHTVKGNTVVLLHGFQGVCFPLKVNIRSAEAAP